MAEEAKRNFQANIGTLLELRSHFQEKITRAQQSKKDGAYLTIHEMEIIVSWITGSVTELSADYTIINRTNRLVNSNYRIVEGLLQKKSCNLKNLLEV